MNSTLTRISVAIVVVLCASELSAAKTRLLRAGSPASDCKACCEQYEFGAPCPNTCALTRIQNLGAGLWLYEAEFNNMDCGDTYPVYMIGNYGKYPNHICEHENNSCESTPPEMIRSDDTIPHVSCDPKIGDLVFEGLDPGDVLEEGENVHTKLTTTSWVRYYLEGPGDLYKAKVWHLSVDSEDDTDNHEPNEIHKTVHVAFEVSDFPDGVDPPPQTNVKDGMAKPCQGEHAISINEGGSRVLLLLQK